MSARGFWRDAGLGLLASIAATLAFHALAPWLGAPGALRAGLLLLAAVAVAATLAGEPVRVGRAVSLAAWTAALGTLVVFDAPLWFWIGLPAFGLWLTRSLYRYHALWQAGADALLSLLALGAAAAALQHSHSLFLALWSWCLVQATVAWLRRDPQAPDAAPPVAEDRYAQAHRSAEAALRRLTLPR